MKNALSRTAVLCAICSGAVFAGPDKNSESEFTPEAYRNPPPECSAAFFWMWNAKLEERTLFAQLDEMAANGIRNVCIHPFPKEFAPGAFTSEMSPAYLSDAYVDILKKVTERARALGMHSWLYDEGGWPSGGAAGLVAKSDVEGAFKPCYIGWNADRSRGFHVWKEDYGTGRRSYPSVIEKGATDRFLSITHERMARSFGGEFGKTVKFAFMDEPEVRIRYWDPALVWSADFAEEFRKRKGYDIAPHLQEIIRNRYVTSGRNSEMMLDYQEVLADLFVERFMLPVRDWCRRHGLKSGGHLSGEDDPEYGCRRGFGNLLKTLRAMDVPGVDVIWRQLWPTRERGRHGRQAPFPRYAASAAHYNGSSHVLSETGGIYGDSLTPLEMKWLCDYQMVRGVNTFVFGYRALSNAGQWMTLFEPHLGSPSPLWGFQRPFFGYLHRTCGMLSRGGSAAEIVVFYDQRSFWTGGAVATVAARQHYAVAAALDELNCDYDFGDDEVFEKAEIAGRTLKAGRMVYSTVVVPGWGRMTDRARAKLSAFASAGGRVLTGADVEKAPRTCGITGVYHERVRVLKRRSGDRSLYFLVCEGESGTGILNVSFPENGTVCWCDPASGKFVEVPRKDGAFKWRFDPCGSALFVVGAEAETREGLPRPGGAGGGRIISDGWSMCPRTRHVAGENDILTESFPPSWTPAKLGDWRDVLGPDFSGTVSYRVTFDSKEGDAWLDLGRVGWACRAKLNGRLLEERYVPPFAWQVELKRGANELEVIVANTLANALSSREIRSRIRRDFPPRSPYEASHEMFDLENNSSGLFGPVRLRMLNGN